MKLKNFDHNNFTFPDEDKLWTIVDWDSDQQNFF